MQVRQLCASLFLGVITLSGCNTTGLTDMVKSDRNKTSSDQTRTRVEGAATGTAINALAGRLGGDSALLSTALSAGAGYVVADEVAKRKLLYVNKEALIKGETKRTAELITETKALNKQLQGDIKRYKKEISATRALIRKNKQEKQILVTQKAAIDDRYNKTKKALKGVENEIKVAESLYAETKHAKDVKKQSLSGWKKKIAGLKAQKSRLERNTGQLQALSNSLAI